jgi:DNA-binding protein H-NS
MKIDLKGKTRKELEKLRNDVDKALAKVAETEKKAALAAAEKAARAHGFSLSELSGVKAGKTAAKPAAKKPARRSGDGRAKVAPKYQNPANKDEKWSGRGRKPKWVEAHLASGGKLEDIAI